MTRTGIALFFLLLLTASSQPVLAAAAQPSTDTPAPVGTVIEQLRERTGQTALEFAQMEAQAALIMMEMSGNRNALDELEEKRKKTKEEVKAIYAKALDMVKKKPEATKLLKEFFVQWLATMDGTMPVPMESKMAYQMRAGESIRKVNEAWYRFEAEAGL